MIVGIGEVAGVDTERTHVGRRGQRGACGSASASSRPTSACDPAGMPRLKSVELAGSPRMSEAVFVNGLKSLPIRFVAA